MPADSATRACYKRCQQFTLKKNACTLYIYFHLKTAVQQSWKTVTFVSSTKPGGKPSSGSDKLLNSPLHHQEHCLKILGIRYHTSNMLIRTMAIVKYSLKGKKKSFYLMAIHLLNTAGLMAVKVFLRLTLS